MNVRCGVCNKQLMLRIKHRSEGMEQRLSKYAMSYSVVMTVTDESAPDPIVRETGTYVINLRKKDPLTVRTVIDFVDRHKLLNSLSPSQLVKCHNAVITSALLRSVFSIFEVCACIYLITILHLSRKYLAYNYITNLHLFI